jgi:hypothetical protein
MQPDLFPPNVVSFYLMMSAATHTTNFIRFLYDPTYHTIGLALGWKCDLGLGRKDLVYATIKINPLH